MSTERPAFAGDHGPSPGQTTLPVYRRPALLFAVAAGLCWASALAMLLSVRFDADATVLAPERVIFYVLVLAAGLLTFVPIQRQLHAPGLALEGVGGFWLLLYTLAFVPAPTDWLLWLPDLPVYLIFIAALFWSVSAVALPIVYLLGARIFRQRARKYDLKRAWRQAHEVGALAALWAGMAGLRVLTPLYVLLVLLILIIAEMLFLSFLKTAS